MATVAGTVEHKDVVLTLLGVSAGLAGLVLVFLGLVVTTYQSFPAPTPAAVLNRYRFVAAMVLAAFAIGMACVVVATVWLLRLGDNQILYVVTAVLFGLQVVALFIATGVTVSRLVWAR